MRNGALSLNPDTLNKDNKDKKNDKKEVIAYIEIPDYDVNKIDVTTVKLSTQKGYVMAELSPTKVDDKKNLLNHHPQFQI